nr:Muc19 precursor [uncultured bacterium]
MLDVLPTPRSGLQLNYAENFHRAIGKTTYGPADFDEGTVSPFDTTSGAGRYYSPANDVGGNQRGYIPDSKGYPFSIRQYTRDNTGRLRSVSGIGYELRLGGSHYRQLAYGTANATQLARVFGSNVGEASSYTRTIARDANGQMTLSYADRDHRVVATAVAGGPPAMLDPLSSVPTDTLYASLNENNELDIEEGLSRSVNRIANGQTATYAFRYSIDWRNYHPTTADGTASVDTYCATCVYELTITITDPDGNPVPLSVTTTGSAAAPTPVINRVFQYPEVTCTATPTESLTFEAFFDKLGEYVITKRLQQTAGGIDIPAEEVSEIPGAIEISFPDGSDPTDAVWQCARTCEEYCSALETTSQAECVQGCATLGPEDAAEQECSNLRLALYADVSPGGYLFEDEAWLDAAVQGIQFPNEDGTPAIYPGTPSEFATIWRPEWAELLLPKHAEQCHLDICNDLTPSRQYELDMAAVLTYAQALTQGYLNPLNMAATSGGPPSSSSNRDPYFASGGYGAGQKTWMVNKLSHFALAQDGVTMLSIWDWVAQPQVLESMATGGLLSSDDARWQLFRSMYLAAKHQHNAEVLIASQTCPYLDSDEAHVHPPLVDPGTDVIESLSEEMDSYCTELCPVRASHWVQTLQQSCPSLDDTKAAQLRSLLQTHCEGDCSLQDPWASISSTDVANSPILTQAAALIAPCPLDAVTADVPMKTERVCRQDCEVSKREEPSQCAEALIDVLQAYVPAASAVAIRLDTEPAAEGLRGCLPPDVKVLLLSDQIRLAHDKQDQSSCELVFADSTGRVITASLIQWMDDPITAPYAGPALVGVSYTGLAVVGKLTNGRKLTLYLFSGCDQFRFVDFARDCHIAQRPNECAREALDALEVFSSADAASTPSNSQPLDVSDCFKKVRWKKPALEFELRDQLKKSSTCKLALARGDGTTIDLLRVGEVGPLRIEPNLPATFPTSATSSLPPYAQLAVEVKLDLWPAPFTAYVFSTCRFGTEDDCSVVPVDIDAPKAPPEPESSCVEDLIEGEADWEDAQLEEAGSIYQTDLRWEHVNKCFENPFKEDFRYVAPNGEHHFTLYYHDRAGNIVQTVPPAGVRVLDTTATRQNVENLTGAPQPQHGLVTRFQYNSLNQIIRRVTPDGGETKYWYNRAGQLRLTQNADQTPTKEYSYTKYDPQNRVVETGVVQNVTAVDPNPLIADSAFPAASSYPLSEVLHTIYDDTRYAGQATSICPAVSGEPHLRGRVALSVVGDPLGTFTSATCYAYDPHGNVATIVQVIDGLGAKRLDYVYDVVSRKIHEIWYQKGQPDAFYHRYVYDASDRLEEVRTSRDAELWDVDARYSYYAHGPLARVELGDARVQGVDYAYTIQGWIKGVNSNTLLPRRDQGHDGEPGSANAFVARDVFGFTLGYFDGDYTPITSDSTRDHHFEAALSRSGFASDADGLFDGNISHSVIALPDVAQTGTLPIGLAYRFDQLSRLARMRTHSNLDQAANAWGTSSGNTGEYQTRIDYDANGNIRTLFRHGGGTGAPLDMDSLYYNYDVTQAGDLVSNRLLHVNDSVPTSNYLDDLDDQGTFNLTNPATHNFAYDGRGNTIRDISADLGVISWNSYNRVDSTISNQGRLPGIRLQYSADQFRVKTVTKKNGPNAGDSLASFLVRDLSGQVVARYVDSLSLPNHQASALDWSIYGMGPIGLRNSASLDRGGPEQGLSEREA